MKTLDIKRVGQSTKGTFGVMVYNEVPFALTMEQPWRDNAEDISCIPPGRYLCQRVNSPHFGDTFEITGVPNRTHVLFHKGNKLADTKGCVMVGEKFEGTFDNPNIEESLSGYNEFMALMRDESTFYANIS